MNPKLLLICAIIVQVNCDCDGFECLSDYIKNFISDNNSTEINSNISNFNNSDDTTSFIDVNDRRNSSLSYFDITELGKSFNQALVDVTTFIKDGLAGMFHFDQEVDVHKDTNNTEIHVKAFGLSNLKEFDNNLTVYEFPDLHVNNFTEFNDDFEALKVEIEQNLQAELEAFISKITENDTLDWDDVATTLSNKLDSRIKDEIKDVTTNLPKVSEDNNSIDKKIKEIIDVVNEPLKVSIDLNTTLKSDTNKSTEKVFLSPNSSNAVITTITALTNITKAPNTLENHIIIEDEATKINRDSIVSTPMPFTLTSRIENPKTISTTTKTQKPTKTTPLIDNALQTKAPIDFNQIKNVKSNEITKEDDSYYEIQDDNSTDYPIIDYVDLYKDTTNEDVEYKPTEIAVVDMTSDPDLRNYLDKGSYINDTTNPGSIFPWIAAIFIKNSSNSQYDYYCDGVLLSDSVIITAARCLLSSNATVNANDVLVFLGKTSLLSSGEGEEIHKVKRLALHENFTWTPEVTSNDLAALELENPAAFNERIQGAACLLKDGESSEAITTAWDANLSIVRFVEKNKTCEKNHTENTFCARFGDTVALCPNYGGVYATLSSESWCVQGLRTADPTSRGYCLEKTIAFTDLRKYSEWIDNALNKVVF